MYLKQSIIIILFLSVLISLSACSRSSNGPALSSLVTEPSPLVQGTQAQLHITLSDVAGVKGFTMSIPEYDVSKTFNCDNQQSCTKDFSHLVPNKDISSFQVLIQAENSKGKRSSFKKTLDVVKQTIQEPHEAICGNSICDYPEEDFDSCSKDCAIKGPESLFDMDAMLDASTLNTRITGENTITTDQGTLKAIDVKYYVTNWRGVDIYNTGTIYIPDNMPAENKGKAAIMQGYSKDVLTGSGFLEDFAQNTALKFGIPVYSCSCGYPAQAFGYKTESELSQAYKLMMTEDNDLNRNVVIPLTQDYMRAMTMLKTFDDAGNPTEFVTTGSSKRGFTQWVLAAVDPRVKGFMSNAFSAPDQMNLWQLVKKEFGNENLYGSADDALAWLQTPPGIMYQHLYDPIQFPDKLQKPLVINIGTNDREPVTSLNSLFLTLEQPKVIEFVANYPHGWGSVQHLANWRSIIDRTFFERKTPAITLDASGEQIVAQVSGGEKLTKATLVYGLNYNKVSQDLLGKEGTWYEISMQQEGDTFSVSKTLLPQNQDYAYYVEVEDTRNGINSYSSSLMYTVSNS